MAFPNRGWLLVLIVSILSSKARGTYHSNPYGASQSSGCASLISANSKFSASSSSEGPGFPVLHGGDVWCAGEIDKNQHLVVDLGRILWVDRVSVQGKPNSEKSVTQYFVKTSTDNVNFQNSLTTLNKKVFFGPWFDGKGVVSTNFSSPVRARYVMFNPSEPAMQDDNHLCMRVDVQSCRNVPTPVDGQWSAWSAYTACSKPCYGVRSRQRTCSNPAPAFGGQSCTGHAKEDSFCNFDCGVPTDGQWASWTAWSSCSKSCGSGSSTRNRACNNPPPSNNGADCPGSSMETKACLDRYCPVDGGWTKWSPFSRCTFSCGGGTQTRYRLCANPLPQHGGQSCQGSNFEQQRCNTQACPINGGWGNWGAWSSCPVSCGGGSQSRSRSCNNPPPSNNGLPCVGNRSETQQCNTQKCPVDGKWSSWTLWSQCSKSCNGRRSRSRQCNNPPPAHGGASCSGDNTESQACNVGACPDPVDGNWTSWGQWSVCSASCSPGGVRSRSRNCTNPPPTHGGKNCLGDSQMTEQCNTQACPVDGNFSAWTPWKQCSATCGGGTTTRTRKCDNPPPSNNGKPCVGDTFQSRECNTQACPVDGKWSVWSDYTKCDPTCGGGRQVRTRACDSPPPSNGGKPCTGYDMETRECNTQECPRDGVWSAWTSTSCSATCGQGKLNRTRTCTNPPPSGGGANCQGSGFQILDCNSGPCPTGPVPTTLQPATTKPTGGIDGSNVTMIDLVFALSAVSGNSFQTYNLMRNTINRFIDTYGADKIHYAIIVYGSSVFRVVNFNHTFPPSANELKTAINKQPPLPGGPVLKDALEETWRIFNETIGRPKARKVLVVITDENSSADKNALVTAVRPLESKILVISVAIGAVNRSELLVISPNPLDVISVGSNIDAGVLSERIMDRILRRDIPLVDIGFALNAASADSLVIFRLMKNVLTTIFDRYGVGRVQFSIIVYGDVVTTRLGEFDNDFTLEDLTRAVNNLAPNPGGSVNLDQALKEARLLFIAKARKDAKKVFVVLTDSLSSDSDNSLMIETARLRKEDVLILGVGIGSQSDQIGKQMNSVLFTSKDYIGVPDYPTERIVVIAEAIMFKALQANVPLIDLTFAMSATSASSVSPFNLMKSTVQSIVQKYGVDRIHYSVIVFGTVATTEIDFSTKFPDREELGRIVSRLPKRGGRPDLVKALQKAKDVFRLREVRPNAKKVLVVIMDNVSVGNRKDLKEVVTVLVNESVLIIGVGVGSSVGKKDLEIITEEIRNIITVGLNKNPDELAKEIMAIILRTSGLSQWSQWGACSKTCRYLGEAGLRRRTRYCRIPELGCDGRKEDIRECNTAQCPGCGERGPLNESSYSASSIQGQPARFAALDTSNPSESRGAWCRALDDVGGYIEVNLGETYRIYRVATKGQEEGNNRWVTSYYLSYSTDGLDYSNYSQALPGNTNPTSVVFNDINATKQVQYVRFHPISFQGRPCMQVAVFGCVSEFIPPVVGGVGDRSDAGKGILIALWILAGILTFLLLMACCYYCCWHVCCGRGKKRRGLAYKDSSAGYDGYLIEDKRWRLAPTAMGGTVPEDEVQEVTIEMKEENAKPSGIIQFGIETDETKEKHVTAADVKSEKPTYSEDVGTIKSGSSMMTMGSADTGYRSTERRKRIKSESAASVRGAGAAEWSQAEEQKQSSGFSNEGYMRSQEMFAEPDEPIPVRSRAQVLRRSQSADEFANVDYDMFENRRGSSQAVEMGRDGYMRMQQASRGSVDRNDGGFAMGTVDVAIAGIRTPDGSQIETNHYDMAEQELTFMADNGGRNVYTLDNGGYRTEEWYSRGGRGPGQLTEEGFKEIHVEHHPIYTEVVQTDDEEFMHSRRV